MVKFSMKTLALAGAAASLVLGSAPPAFAGEGRHGPSAYGGYRAGVQYRDQRPRAYYGSRQYRRTHHRGLSGGEAALLAAGLVGGIILIDSAIERDRARYARYDDYDRYDRDDRYDQYDRYDRYDDDRRFEDDDRSARDLYYRRDDRPSAADEPEFEDDSLDDELAGGPSDFAGSRYNYGAAYNDCKAETRDAARDSGVLVALPARPDRIEEIDDGAAVRFTAEVYSQDLRGERVQRTMTCEADEAGVRFLEIA